MPIISTERGGNSSEKPLTLGTYYTLPAILYLAYLLPYCIAGSSYNHGSEGFAGSLSLVI